MQDEAVGTGEFMEIIRGGCAAALIAVKHDDRLKCEKKNAVLDFSGIGLWNRREQEIVLEGRRLEDLYINENFDL